MVNDAGAGVRRRSGVPRVMLAAAGALVLALVAVFGIGVTRAAWLDGEHSRASLASGVVPAPGTLGCSGGGTVLLGNAPPTVTFTWAAAAAPANALPITAYSWTLAQGATVVASGTTSTTARTAAIAGNVAGVGSYRFTVVTRGSSGWVSTTGATGTWTKADLLGLLLTTSACSVP